jgi:hypothetical protein
MMRSAAAESDREALEVARRAHRQRHQSFILLWEKHGTWPINTLYPDNFDDGCSGPASASPEDPARCATRCSSSSRFAGIYSHLVCRFAFGDLSL